MSDDFGDRMKGHEAVETARTLDKNKPIYARLDGRSFSKFTKHMNRPYDSRMSRTMIETTKYLVDKTHANAGYTSSDEISLVWSPNDTETGEQFFNGKVQKLCSVLASMAAGKFAFEYANHFGSMSDQIPHFDCRVINVPDESEACNMFLWRELDAEKNSVSMLARHYFSHSELHKKSTGTMIDMLRQKNIDINAQPTYFRRGTWVKRIVEERTLTDDELIKIPESHRPVEGTLFKRKKVVEYSMPRFITVTNRVDVLFTDSAPII